MAELLTDDEAAGVLRISLGGLKELVAGGVLHPSGDIGRRFSAAEVEKVLNHAQPDEPLPEPPEPAPPGPGGRRVLDVGQVGALYGADSRTVANWDKKGKLPPSFRTPGGHRRWYEDEILAQLSATRSRPGQRP